jgi:hypothetical protein
MAIDILGASLSTTLTGRQALVLVGSAASVSRLATPNSVFPSQLNASRAVGPIIFNVSQASTVVATSLVAGAGILSTLRALENGLSIATQSGIVSPNTNLLDGAGTRISRVNITGQAKRIVDAIDSLVKTAGVGGANLIASGGRRVTVQTSEFGGRITISPQPLDSLGLGIGDLSALTADQARSALAKVRRAVTTAETRIRNLEVLQSNLGLGSGINQAFIRIINGGETSFLPRGSLVNQVA